jgi:hypothetical protein
MDLSTYLERLIERFVSKDPCRQQLKDRTGLVTGSFSTGVPRIDLEVGESLTLVSQPDGIRYVIKVFGLSYDESADGSASG